MADPRLTLDDALAFLVEFARAPRDEGYGTYGYEVWVPNAVAAYLREIEKIPRHAVYDSPRHRDLSPIFYDAAWQLARRGVFRAGVKNSGAQAVPDGGQGYSLTAAGRAWIAEGAKDLILFQQDRLAQLFDRFRERFGPGYLQRALEAVRCNTNGTFLACCAMCGAAAESILLAAAIARRGDEPAVLRDYRASGGRSRVEKGLLGQVSEPTASRFHTFMDLLAYWRDDSSHGTATTIGDVEAYDALSRLLRLAHFASDHWSELTGK